LWVRHKGSPHAGKRRDKARISSTINPCSFVARILISKTNYDTLDI